MSLGELQIRHSLGIRPDVPGCIVFKDKQTIIYPCGKNLVVANLENGKQQFIPYAGDYGDDGVTALAITPNRRFLAVAEQYEPAVVTIWDLQTTRRRKVITAKEGHSQIIISMCFSPDSKYLVTQGGRPDWTLSYWNWEKPKFMASIKSTNSIGSPIYQVLFNSADNTLVSVVGDCVFRLYRYGDGMLKQTAFQKVAPMPIRCHAWLTEDKLMIGTDNGQLKLYQSGELKQEIELKLPEKTHIKSGGDQSLETVDEVASDEGNTEAEDPATAKIVYSMCVGGRYLHVSFAQRLYCFERTGADGLYEEVGQLQVLHPSTQRQTMQDDFLHIGSSPGDDCTVAVTRGCQVYSVPSGYTAPGPDGNPGNMEPALPHFHNGPITGISACVRKPIVATCGVDRKVCVWNYSLSTQLLAVQYKDEAYCVALHPTGLFILVGFSDKLRYMNIFINDLRAFKEFPIRACRECAFSNGGQFFAAVNGNLIQIFNSYTYEIAGNFKGHSNKIRGLQWTPDDSRLVSCGIDGGVYEWHLSNMTRGGECVLKGTQYTSVAFTPDLRTVLVAASDNSMKEISPQDSEIVRSVPTEMNPTQIAIGNGGRTVYVGALTGSLQSMRYPLAPPLEYTEIMAHGGLVTKIELSRDGEWLITGGEDGSVYFFNIRTADAHASSARVRDVPYSEEVLVPLGELREKNARAEELAARVEELRVENEYQLRMKSLAHNEIIKEMTDKFHQEIETLKQRNQVLKKEKKDEEARHEEERARLLAKNNSATLDMETSNNKKLMDEYEKFEELQAKGQRMQEQYEARIKAMALKHDEEKAEVTAHYEVKLKEMQDELKHAEELRNQMAKEFEEMKDQIEDDCDREILDDAYMFEKQMREVKEQNIKLAGEAGIMKKKTHSLAKEIQDHKTAIEKLQAERNKLQGVIRTLEKDIVGLKKEMQERDETIMDKEKQIVDIRKKNQELEKFKFVLDFKIKDLKRQIEPRDLAITSKDLQLSDMESELTRFHKSSDFFQQEATVLTQKLQSKEKRMKEQQERILTLEAALKRLKTDLNDALGLIQYPKDLKRLVMDMGTRHLSKDEDVSRFQPPENVLDEDKRQLHHLAQTISQMRAQARKDQKITEEEKAHILADNVQLIQEINDLRSDLKSTRTRVHDLEMAVKSHKLRAQRTVSSTSVGGSMTALTASPVAGYGTAVSLPASTSLDHVAGGVGGNDVERLREVLELQNEELQALRKQYRKALAGQNATLTFPPIRSTSSITGQ